MPFENEQSAVSNQHSARSAFRLKLDCFVGMGGGMHEGKPMPAGRPACCVLRWTHPLLPSEVSSDYAPEGSRLYDSRRDACS